MKKRIAFRKLGRTTEHRLAMFRNMLCSLIEHERITTTTPKAKEMRRWADRAVGYAKRWATHMQVAHDLHFKGEVEAGRAAAAKATHQLKLANSIVRQPAELIKLLHHLGPRYLDRDGGYTRVMQLQKRRAGDKAPMAIIEYVDREGELRRARGGKADSAEDEGEDAGDGQQSGDQEDDGERIEGPSSETEFVK